MSQLYIMYAATIALMTHRWGQAQSAMLLGNVFCIFCLVGEQVVPMPMAQTVFIADIKLPFLDPIPGIFAFLFLIG
eukprot:CAMPEP_0119024964 /NCGR_PEP_ID=MMETSP1176-20130426/32892_1 /TAXON_ID=265551 /ORGANISM="Synedropsis recta cf, Strain CCMP1620" /LENGTH=75 /DNA_ID=CAMNT_0006980395 /DNA_START=17 /DNA_END=241 /DNA_ORIENTATION=-